MPGYRDPPVHSRFKPGQSGNPGGGPKGPRRKPVQRPSTYLDQKVTCTIGGKRFKGQRREAVVLIAALWSIKKPVPASGWAFGSPCVIHLSIEWKNMPAGAACGQG